METLGEARATIDRALGQIEAAVTILTFDESAVARDVQQQVTHALDLVRYQIERLITPPPPGLVVRDEEREGA